MAEKKEAAVLTAHDIRMIPIRKLFVNDPTRLSRDEGHIQELTADYVRRLKEYPNEHPIQTPLRVLPVGENFDVIAGAYRLQAFQRVPPDCWSAAGVASDQVPCLVLPHDLDHAGRVIERFRDNKLQFPYTVVEKAHNLMLVMELRKVSLAGAAKALGIGKSDATKLFKVLQNFPEDLHSLIGSGDDRIPFTTAYTLTQLHPDVGKIRELADRVLKGLLTRDDAEEVVKDLLKKARTGKPKPVRIRPKGIGGVATLMGSRDERLSAAKALIVELTKWIKNANATP